MPSTDSSPAQGLDRVLWSALEPRCLYFQGLFATDFRLSIPSPLADPSRHPIPHSEKARHEHHRQGNRRRLRRHEVRHGISTGTGRLCPLPVTGLLQARGGSRGGHGWQAPDRPGAGGRPTLRGGAQRRVCRGRVSFAPAARRVHPDGRVPGACDRGTALYEGRDRRPPRGRAAGVSVHSQARGTPESDNRDLLRRPQATDCGQAGTRRAAAPGRALLVCAAEPERWLAQPTR